MSYFRRISVVGLYEAEAKGVTSMGHVHAEHVPLEEHPMYEQMPHIVFTGLPDEFYE